MFPLGLLDGINISFDIRIKFFKAHLTQTLRLSFLQELSGGKGLREKPIKQEKTWVFCEQILGGEMRESSHMIGFCAFLCFQMSFLLIPLCYTAQFKAV